MFKMWFGDIICECYTVDDFPYERIPDYVHGVVGKGKKLYANFVNTFDIECTTIDQRATRNEEWFDGRTFGFMYVWMWAIGEDLVCVGRTWKEWQDFRYELIDRVGCKFITWSHFLAYEFQNFRNFLPEPKRMFARNMREPVFVDYGEQEFRCSYILTNKSLDLFAKTTPGVTVYKASGEEFDYSKRRFPDTELSENEWDYCIRDVVAQLQAIKGLLKSTGYDLSTVPLTSTGFVRRDYQKACCYDTDNQKRVQNCKLNTAAYKMCEVGRRGGIAGSYELNTGMVIDGAMSMDKKSSYPYQMMCKYFPNSRFLYKDVVAGSEAWFRYLERNACLMVVEFTELMLRPKSKIKIPYLSKSKCIAIDGGVFGNGKVYKASRLMCCITEVDLKIIEKNYWYNDVRCVKMLVAERGMLSYAFRKQLKDMFQTKEEIGFDVKRLEGDAKKTAEEEYMKFKNKINASFGMMLTAILHDDIVYSGKKWERKVVNEFEYDSLLKKHYESKNTFLNYQDGVWVTAHARADLYEGLTCADDDTIACDTDSVKFRDWRWHGEGELMGDTIRVIRKFEAINERIRGEASGFEVKPYALVNDKRIYLGVWEEDAVYEQFITLGAKKYAYTLRKDREEILDDTLEYRKPLHITVSGLRKSADKWFDEEVKGIQGFTVGRIVPPGKSGRTASYYVDVERPHELSIDGHVVVVGSNVGVVNVSYTLGVTNEWMEMLDAVAEDRLPGDNVEDMKWVDGELVYMS